MDTGPAANFGDDALLAGTLDSGEEYHDAPEIDDQEWVNERIRRDAILQGVFADAIDQRPSTAPEMSFSFSEDDLVPDQPSWKTSRHDDPYDFQHHNYNNHNTYSEDSPSVYSKSTNTSPQSRITIQRTLLVSEQDVPSHVAPQSPVMPRSQNPTGPESTGNAPANVPNSSNPQNFDSDLSIRARTLSRSFSSIARKTKIARAVSPTKQYFARHEASLKPSSSSGEISRADTPRTLWRTQSSGKRRPGNIPGSAAGQEEQRHIEEPRRLMVSNDRSAIPPPPPSPSLEIENTREISASKSFSSSIFSPFTRSERHDSDNPGQVPNERRATPTQHPKKRDDQWAIFRNLETDCRKFQEKSLPLRLAVHRSSLLQFLRNHQTSYDSVMLLSAEDLDRRVNILDKWWSASLDLLNRQQNEHGMLFADQLALLEGVSGIMERPEWRAYPSQFCPVRERSATASSFTSRANADKDQADFLTESVHHNVRNVFVQNLFAQIIYAVGTMSVRHAPEPLVALCGHTCAYAFFFCPGIADILVRLWKIQLHDMHRVVEAASLPEAWENSPTTELESHANFPQCMQNLSFTTLKDAAQKLRQDPILPLGVEKVQWRGHWLDRWTGKESELFYVFVKHFHLLVAEFLPLDASEKQRFMAPGMLFVRAQILKNLDSTLRRPAGPQQAAAAAMASSLTFADLISTDGSPPALPSLAANATRSTSENRLINLLRESVNWSAESFSFGSSIFIETFGVVLRSTTKSLSLFNYNACFTLCDFFQESVGPIARFQNSHPHETDTFDWSFWLEVFKKMVQNENTTSEIRLYACLFSVWDSITSVSNCKERLCLDLLLQPDHFQRTFNHWCPMVRAYYMRILCWRIGRCDSDDDADETRLKILSTLMTRLQTMWSYHKYLIRDAQTRQVLPPSTAPCNPAPGRKLLIIRIDLPITNSLTSQDSRSTTVAREAPRGRASLGLSDVAREGFGSFSTNLLERVTASWDSSLDATRKRSALWRSMLGYKSTNTPSRSPSPSRRRSLGDSVETDDSGDAAESSQTTSDAAPRESLYEQRPNLNAQTRAKNSSKREQGGQPIQRDSSPLRQASFKFSLEAVDRRPHNVPADMRLEPPRLPLVAQRVLQGQPDFAAEVKASKPPRSARASSKYTGRALAEWTWVVNECQNFFERRRNEGVPTNRLVETPVLGVEPLRRLA